MLVRCELADFYGSIYDDKAFHSVFGVKRKIFVYILESVRDLITVGPSASGHDGEEK